MKKHNLHSGSEESRNGGLKGTTDTDYFYFLCPKCKSNGVMRVLDYEVVTDKAGNPYDEDFPMKANRGFTLLFRLYCESCSHKDLTKISNLGLQSGTLNA